jgi:hypothetical protein
MRPALLPALLIAVLCAALVAGCGSSGGTSGGTTGSPSVESTGEGPAGAAVTQCDGGVRATGVPCAKAEAVRSAWRAAPGCHVGGGDSHASCRVEGLGCIAAAVQDGTVVSCALPGRSVFFLERG